jgi:methylmalonyl-CoA mutase N-terminal domain/subunit
VRSDGEVQQVLSDLKRAADSNQNLMPPLIEAVRAETTVGEICNALKDVFGIYQEPLS